MWFKHRAWVPIAWALSFVNLVSVWFAAEPAEPWHATAHAVLAVGFALGARHLMARTRTATHDERPQHAIDQDAHSQQAIDDMQARVLELEERLDFTERMLAKTRDADRLGAEPR